MEKSILLRLIRDWSLKKAQHHRLLNRRLIVLNRKIKQIVDRILCHSLTKAKFERLQSNLQLSQRQVNLSQWQGKIVQLAALKHRKALKMLQIQSHNHAVILKLKTKNQRSIIIFKRPQYKSNKGNLVLILVLAIS